MRSTFKILFYIKKNALKSNGKAPVMARISTRRHNSKENACRLYQCIITGIDRFNHSFCIKRLFYFECRFYRFVFRITSGKN